jgi:tetratricopeptide (TPR) repeat protein
MRRTLAVLASALVLAPPHAVAGTAAHRAQGERALAAAPAASTAELRPFALVLPLRPDDDDPRSLWLGEGLALLVSDGLTALGRPAVSRTARERAFEALELPGGVTLSRATLLRAGQVLGVRHLVLGSVRTTGDRLQVRARMIDVDAAGAAPEVEIEGALRDLVDVAEQLARRLAGVPPAGDGSPRAIEPPPSLEVFEAFVKGLVAETPATQQRFLLDAVRQAPTYGRAQVALWEVCTQLQDHERALEAARAVLPSSRFAQRARFLAARSLLSLGRLDEAFEALQALNKEGPSAAVYNNLGVVQIRRGENAPGGVPAYFFSKAAELDPDVADYFFNLGYAYWLARDMPAAIYWLREVVRLRPGDGEAHYVLGAALQLQGAAAEAARERDLARRLSSVYAEWEARAASDPKTLGVPQGLERIADALDRLPVALDSALVNAAQQEHQQLARFHYDRGVRLAEQQADREAILEFRKSLYLSPYQAETHLALARVLVRSGRLKDAIESFTISLWSAESVEARLGLAQAWLELGDPEAARPHAERAAVLAPGNPEARALLDRLAQTPQTPPR